MSGFIGMTSSTGLKRSGKAARKIDTLPGSWVRTKGRISKIVNRQHFSPSIFTYRRGDKIVKGAKWILIDIDDPGSNVEQKLLEWKLCHIITPSASATDSVDYKKHIFVETLPLSTDAAIARAQIKDFYDALDLEKIDMSAVDPVRYFAPCGAAEVMGSKAWEERIAWCDERTRIIRGSKWVPTDENSVHPIHSGSGKQVVLKGIKEISFSPAAEWEPELLGRDNPNTGGISYFLELDTPISLGNGRWTTAEQIAMRLGDGEVVSNLIGCPGYNQEHDDPSTVGYGYVTRKGDWVFFSCGGKSCRGHSYSLLAPVFDKEVKSNGK